MLVLIGGMIPLTEDGKGLVCGRELTSWRSCALTSPWSSHDRRYTRKPGLICSPSPSGSGRFIWRLVSLVIELPAGDIYFQALALALSTTRRWSLGSFVGSAPLKLCKKGRWLGVTRRAEAIESSKYGKQVPQHVVGATSSLGCKFLEGTSS